MLAKLTCRGRDFPAAVTRARRALAEFRIRGVATNIPFLRAVLDDEAFVAGDLSTSFIDERPQLLTSNPSRDRATKLLNWLADVTVNRPYGEKPLQTSPGSKLPHIDLSAEPPAGTLARLRSLGPEGFARALREQKPLAVTETTFRDAHQSLLATRVRTRDLVRVGPHVARMTPELLSVEAWGGATYDVALRFLAEDPWERLAALREAMPNIPIQMLLRGRNTVGYTPRPVEVTDAFVSEAALTGVDVFRIFDALNDVSQMKPAIDAVRATNTAIAEVALCYTSDLLNPDEQLYTLDYYLRLAEQIVEAGAHVLAIKDMAGLLRPAAAAKLVTALRERFDLPVHLHTHDTAGGQLATLLAASAAGVDAVDAAAAPMSGTTSQPSLSALVAALAHTDRDTGLDLQSVCDLEPYWEAVRHLYRPFESGLPSPTGRVYHHEIPGGQLSNLRQQAIALGLADDFELIEDMYAAADRLLGRIPKVTPSSKVVGDLALALVAVRADPADFEQNPQNYDIPDSVVGFMAGSSAICRADGRSRSARRCWRAVRSRSTCRHSPTRSGPDSPETASNAAARSTGCCSPRPPASSRRTARRTATCRRSAPPTTSTGSSRGGAHRRDRPGRAALRRSRGHRRGRPQGHPHRHDDAQRPAPARVRARPEHQGRHQADRARRHHKARSGGGAVRRRRDAEGGRGRHRPGRPPDRVDRGHEDGSGHHRTRRWGHRAPCDQ
nr:hypothetical protein GCM10025699_24040 [Microbacterium flavescens]